MTGARRLRIWGSGVRISSGAPAKSGGSAISEERHPIAGYHWAIIPMTGSLSLSLHPGDLVRLACEKCGRAGVYRKAQLIERFALLSSARSFMFAAPEKLAALYKDAGVTPDSEIITYCGRGNAAACGLLALRSLGYRNVRLLRWLLD